YDYDLVAAVTGQRVCWIAVKPRSRSLIGPIAASSSATNSNRSTTSVTATNPAFFVNHGSAAPTRTPDPAHPEPVSCSPGRCPFTPTPIISNQHNHRRPQGPPTTNQPRVSPTLLADSGQSPKPAARPSRAPRPSSPAAPPARWPRSHR